MKNDNEIFELVKKSEDETLEAPKKSTSYYLASFKKIAAGIFVFNTPAFLFGGLWMLYRRMYLMAFLFFIISFFTPVPYILLATIFGFTANHIYWHNLKERFMDGKQKWGVNKWIIPTIILICVALTFLSVMGDASLPDPTHPNRLRGC
jgi:uncharacterized paraquat-inducible protein A